MTGNKPPSKNAIQRFIATKSVESEPNASQIGAVNSIQDLNK